MSQSEAKERKRKKTGKSDYSESVGIRSWENKYPLWGDYADKETHTSFTQVYLATSMYVLDIHYSRKKKITGIWLTYKINLRIKQVYHRDNTWSLTHWKILRTYSLYKKIKYT